MFRRQGRGHWVSTVLEGNALGQLQDTRPRARSSRWYMSFGPLPQVALGRRPGLTVNHLRWREIILPRVNAVAAPADVGYRSSGTGSGEERVQCGEAVNQSARPPWRLVGTHRLFQFFKLVALSRVVNHDSRLAFDLNTNTFCKCRAHRAWPDWPPASEPLLHVQPPSDRKSVV